MHKETINGMKKLAKLCNTHYKKSKQLSFRNAVCCELYNSTEEARKIFFAVIEPGIEWMFSCYKPRNV